MTHRPVKAFLSFAQQKHWFSLSYPPVSTVNPLVPLSWELELGLLPMKASQPPSGSPRSSTKPRFQKALAVFAWVVRAACCSSDWWLVTNAHPAGRGNKAGCETGVLLLIPPAVRCICDRLQCKVAACMSEGRTGGQMVLSPHVDLPARQRWCRRAQRGGKVTRRCFSLQCGCIVRRERAKKKKKIPTYLYAIYKKTVLFLASVLI